MCIARACAWHAGYGDSTDVYYQCTCCIATCDVHSGYSDGYPVLFDNHITEKRAGQMLSYVRDGGFLSAAMTQSMTVEVRTVDVSVGEMGGQLHAMYSTTVVDAALCA